MKISYLRPCSVTLRCVVNIGLHVVTPGTLQRVSLMYSQCTPQYVCAVRQEALRRASFVVHKLATQLIAATATMYSRKHPELSKRNSGILDIVLGMPDLMDAGRK